MPGDKLKVDRTGRKKWARPPQAIEHSGTSRATFYRRVYPRVIVKKLGGLVFVDLDSIDALYASLPDAKPSEAA